MVQIKTWVQIKFINVQCMQTQLVLQLILIMLITHKIHSLAIHSLKITEVVHHSPITMEMLDPVDIVSKLISTDSLMKIAKVFSPDFEKILFTFRSRTLFLAKM